MKRGSTILILSIRILMFISFFLLLQVITGQSSAELGKWWSIVCTGCNVLTIVFLIRYAKQHGMNYFEMINFHKNQLKVKPILMGIGIVLIVGIGGMFLSGALVFHQFPYLAKSLIEPIPVWVARINILLLPITTTLAEDGLYLGIGVNRASKGNVQILIPAIFYALQHSFIPFYFDFDYMLYRFLSFLPLTIIFCLWYFKKKNPVPIMIGHLVINFATVIQIFIVSMWPFIYESM